MPSGSPGGETIGPGGWLARRVNREVGSNQPKSLVVDAGGGGSHRTKAAGLDGEARREVEHDRLTEQAHDAFFTGDRAEGFRLLSRRSAL